MSSVKTMTTARVGTDTPPTDLETSGALSSNPPTWRQCALWKDQSPEQTSLGPKVLPSNISPSHTCDCGHTTQPSSFFLATPYDLWDLSFPKPLGCDSTSHWATRKIPTTQLSHRPQSAQERTTHWGVERRSRSQDTKELSMFLFLVLRKQSTALKWSAS